MPKNQGYSLTIHLLLQWDRIEYNVYDLVYKVTEAEGAVVKLTEQLTSSETWVMKLEGLVEEQRRASEDFKEQMSILVSKLLEGDSNIKQSFKTVQKRLNWCSTGTMLKAERGQQSGEQSAEGLGMGPLRDALCLLEATFEAAEENPTIELDSWGKGDGVLDRRTMMTVLR